MNPDFLAPGFKKTPQMGRRKKILKVLMGFKGLLAPSELGCHPSR